MRDEMFEELVASVREGGAILRGKKAPSRTFTIEGPDVKSIRKAYAISQNEFAHLFGVGVRTVRNWEQGRAAPRGTARVLLKVAEKHPEEVWDVVQHERLIQNGAKVSST